MHRRYHPYSYSRSELGRMFPDVDQRTVDPDPRSRRFIPLMGYHNTETDPRVLEFRRAATEARRDYVEVNELQYVSADARRKLNRLRRNSMNRYMGYSRWLESIEKMFVQAAWDSRTNDGEVDRPFMAKIQNEIDHLFRTERVEIWRRYPIWIPRTRDSLTNLIDTEQSWTLRDLMHQQLMINAPPQPSA